MKSVVSEERKKYDEVHTDSEYGCGPRQVDDLKDLKLPFSKRFKEVIEENNTALDIACGGGTVLTYVDELGITATGVDISKNAVAKVNEKFDTYVASASELPFEDEAFDVSYFLDGMEHIPVEIEDSALNESFRVAKKYVCHAVALFGSFFNGVALHPNLKTYDEWKEKFDLVAEEFGFELDMEHFRNDTIYVIYKKK